MPVAIRKRPLTITILCVVGFVVSAIQILLISYPGIRAVAKWYPIVYGLIVAFRFISLVGLWQMKKWAAELFAYVIIIKITVQVLVGDFSMLSKADAFISVGFAVVFLFFYRRMGKDL